MVAEYGKKQPGTITIPDLPSSSLRHAQEHHLTTGREDPGGQGQSTSSTVLSPSSSISMHEDGGDNGGHSPKGKMGAVEDEALSNGFSPSAEPERSGPTDLSDGVHARKSPLVATEQESPQLTLHRPSLLDHSHGRCQKLGLGGLTVCRRWPRAVGTSLLAGWSLMSWSFRQHSALSKPSIT